MAVARTLELPGYQVMQYLGSGANSTIWSIRDERTGRLYALKRIVKNEPADERFFEQARNEFATAQQLDHPSIRKCYRLRSVRRWIRARELLLFMELCPGESVQQNRPTDVRKAVRIFQKTAEALHFMHRCGFLHTDMKPNNIIVGPDESIKVIDLGHSCRLGTVKERIQGTPDFIAPEQVHRRPLDARTDVFNFGAAMYWTLTGTAINTVMPKRSDTIQLKSELELTPVTEVNPAVPPALAALVADCVSFQPGQRPPSMEPVQIKLELIRKHLERKGDDGGPAARPGN
jgi:eukaryotic-like serine/threonine-protein kinase